MPHLLTRCGFARAQYYDARTMYRKELSERRLYKSLSPAKEVLLRDVFMALKHLLLLANKMVVIEDSSHCREGSWLMRLLLVVCLFLTISDGHAQAAQAPGAQAPLVLYTDIASGPSSGGENDKGIYLSVFGKHFGNSGLGTTTRVYVGDAEVDEYRSLGISRGRVDIQQITAQVGALGKPQPGVPLPIKVVVDGRASNTDLTFTVNPGKIYFVANDGTGSDTNTGTFMSPYRTVQRGAVLNNNGTAGCPASAGAQPISAAGVWGLIQPGDFIVMRGGRWTDISKDNFFLRVQNKSGSAPTGKAGTGPITIMGYPGENVFIDRTNTADNQRGGGISSADTARQRLGCGAWVTITNIKVESGFNEGMITTQRGADNPYGSHWRVVNNEMTAVSCQHNTKCKGAGVSGSGVGGYWLGNHVHDVYDKPDLSTSFENHGFYLDGIGSYEIAYNRIENIYGGNGVQAYSTTSAITNNVSIHHNLIRNVGKHGIAIADGSEAGIVVYNNVVYGTDVAGLLFNTRDLTGARIYNNTFFDTDRLNKSGSRAALMNDWHLAPGSVEIRNNIFVPGAPGRSYVGGSVGFGAVAGTVSNNLWFNGRGPIVGVGNVAANPLFVSTIPGAEDLRLRAGSPAVDAGSAAVSGLVTNDFAVSTTRPQGKRFDIGAYEPSP